MKTLFGYGERVVTPRGRVGRVVAYTRTDHRAHRVVVRLPIMVEGEESGEHDCIYRAVDVKTAEG